MSRHTMGRDWGGRRPLNPRGIPKVSAKEVEALARELGIEVRRGDYLQSILPDGTHPFYFNNQMSWWLKDSEKGWLTAGGTNYLCLQILQRIKDDLEKDKPKVPEPKEKGEHCIGCGDLIEPPYGSTIRMEGGYEVHLCGECTYDTNKQDEKEWDYG